MPFEDAVKLVSAQDQAASASTSAEGSPDEAVRAFEVSSATGLPAGAIAPNIDQVEKQHKQFLAQQILAGDPALTSFVQAHPLHGQLVSDDLGNLHNFNQAYNRLTTVDPFKAGIRGFAEHFGSETPFEYHTAVMGGIDKVMEHPGIAAVAATIGIPIETVGRIFSGGMGFAHEFINQYVQDLGFSEQAAGKFSNDIVGMLEYELIKPEVRLEPGRPASSASPQAPAEGVGVGGQATLASDARRFAERIGPFLEAGEKPPPGASPVTDLLHEHEADRAAEKLKEAFDTADKTQLKERSPEKFRELMDHSPNQTVRIPTEALQDPKVAEALGVPLERLQAPGSVTVQLKDLLSLDKDQFEAIADDVAVGDGLSKNEVKELKEVIAYHGSEDVMKQLDPSKTRLRRGVFFAEDPAMASAFAEGTVQDRLPTAELGMHSPDKVKQFLSTTFDNDTVARLSSLIDEFDALDKQGMQLKPGEMRPELFQRLRDIRQEIAPYIQEATRFIGRPNVTKVKIDLGKTFEYDFGGREFDLDEERRVINKARVEGYDSVTFTGAQGYGKFYSIFKQEQIKSPYDPVLETIRETSGLEPPEGGVASESLKDLSSAVPLSRQAKDLLSLNKDQFKAIADDVAVGDGLTKNEAKELAEPRPPKQQVTAYHGTTGDITDTSTAFGGSRGGIASDQGVTYLSPTRQLAERYGQNILERNVDLTNAKAYDATALVDDPQFIQEMHDSFVQDAQARMGQGADLDRIERSWRELLNRMSPTHEMTSRNDLGQVRYNNAITGAIIARAKAEGADVAVIKNMAEGRGAATDQYLVLNQRALSSPEPVLDTIRETSGLEPIDLEPKPLGAAVPLSRQAIGRTGRELTRYEQLIAQRDAEDVEWRLARAEAQARRENSADWKAEADRIQSEVEAEVRARPEIAAYRFFDDGQFVGQKLQRRPKLARDRLTDEEIDQLPDRFVGDRGLDPDDVANLFNYQTGAELIRSLSSVERQAAGFRGDIVKRLTNAEIFRQVNEKLGETAAERLEEAKDHALSTTQMDMLHEQMMALGTRIGRLPDSAFATEFGALRLLDEEIFGAMKSDRYLRESAKASRRLEKALLADDPLTAFQNAQAQYISAQMAKGAWKVEKLAKVFDRQAKRFRDREVSGFETEETAPYKRWVQDILMRLGRQVNRTREDLNVEIAASPDTTLSTFVESAKSRGREIKIPDWLLDPNFSKPIEEMPVAQARQAMAAVNSLVHNGREEGKIISAGQKMDLNEAVTKAVEQIKKSREITGPAENLAYQEGAWTEFRKTGRTYLAITLSIDNILNRMDHFDPFGFFNQWVGRPIFEAGNYESKLVREIAKEYGDLPGQMSKEEMNRPVPNTLFRRPDPEFNFEGQPPVPMTRWNLRAVLLNVGNASNMKKLADGYKIQPAQIMQWLFDNTTKADWDWAQAHGDLFGKLWKLSQNLYRRLYGEAPESLELTPIQTPFGTYPGWYHPLIEDRTYVRPSARKPQGEDLLTKEYQRASTPAGYTESRTGVEYPLSLELDAVPGRFHHEIHDIAFREPIINASKIIYNPKFRNAMRANYGKEFEERFIPWLQDIANSANTVTANQEALARWAEFFRSNAIVTMVGLNPRTIEKHTTTAALRSAEEVGFDNFKNAVQGLFSSDPTIGAKNWNWAMDTFEELQRRHQNYMETISGVQQSALVGKDWRREMQRLQTLPLAKLDLASAVPTAIAAFNKAKLEGRTDADAIYLGNRAVARAHGSTAITYRPEIMRRGIAGIGGPWIASLYNFMNRIANRQYELAVKAKEIAGLATKGETEEALSRVPDFMVGAVVSVLAVALIEEAVTPIKEDKKESFEKHVAKIGLKSAAAPWPVFRDLVSSWVEGKDASIGFANSEIKPLTDLGRDLATGEVGFNKQHAGKTVKHATTVFGLLTGLTNAEEGNIAEFLYDLHTGKARPKSMKDWWRGLTKGETRPRENRPDLVERGLRVIEGGR